jgi:para-nitrobenzyl esterase
MLVGWRVGGDQMMGEPARFVARAVAAQGIPSYYYRFSYVGEALRATPMGGMGAMHASEIPYFFRTVNAALKDKMAKADEAISDKAIVYFSSFAKNGNPSGEGVPQWPAYEPKTDTIMDFTTTGPVAGSDPRKERLDLIEALATKKPAAAQESAPAGK